MTAELPTLYTSPNIAVRRNGDFFHNNWKYIVTIITRNSINKKKNKLKSQAVQLSRIVLILIILSIFPFSRATAVDNFLPTKPAIAEVVEGQNYFVDGVNGSDANSGLSRVQAWRTIQKAVDSVLPGDFIYVGAGTYHEAINFSRSGEAEKPITLKPYNQDIVIINGGNSSTIHDVIGTQYWIIDGFTLEGQASYIIKFDAWGCDGSCRGTHYWTIKNCKILGPVLIYGSFNTIEGNEIDGRTNNGDGNGIREHFEVSHHNLYRSNFIHHFSSRGLWSMNRTHDSVFDNNIVQEIGTSTSGQCIDADGFGTVEWRHTITGNKLSQCGENGVALENVFDSVVTNNIIHDIGQQAIIVINYGWTIPSPGEKKCEVGGENNQYGDVDGNNDCEGNITRNRIVQNIIYRGGTNGGIRILHAGGVSLLGNLVAFGSGKGIVLDSGAQYCPQTVIQGNILAKNYRSQILVWDTTSLTSDDHNLFFITNSRDAYEVNLMRYSLSEYQSLSNKGQASLLGDPKFTNPTNDDFHPLNGSPSIDKGIDYGITFDLDGYARPQALGFDIGPYEFPIFTIDSSPTTVSKNDTLTITIAFATNSKPIAITSFLPVQLDFLSSSTNCPLTVTYSSSTHTTNLLGSPQSGLICSVQVNTRVNTDQRIHVTISAAMDDGVSIPKNLSATIILNGSSVHIPIIQIPY